MMIENAVEVEKLKKISNYVKNMDDNELRLILSYIIYKDENLYDFLEDRMEG